MLVSHLSPQKVPLLQIIIYTFILHFLMYMCNKYIFIMQWHVYDFDMNVGMVYTSFLIGFYKSIWSSFDVNAYRLHSF